MRFPNTVHAQVSPLLEWIISPAYCRFVLLMYGNHKISSLFILGLLITLHLVLFFAFFYACILDRFIIRLLDVTPEEMGFILYRVPITVSSSCHLRDCFLAGASGLLNRDLNGHLQISITLFWDDIYS